MDECINPRLAKQLRICLPNHIVDTVREKGWIGCRDHLLIQKIKNEFDVFVTIDRGFEFEHNLNQLSFGIIILATPNNQMPSYERLLDRLLAAIIEIDHGKVVHVG